MHTAVKLRADNQPHLFFTAPWEPIVVRRGDALGLRGLTDQFANSVAPQLSNRIQDGRWLTILAWCLVRSHEVFCVSGGRSVTVRAQQQARYAWLRPLELMWVARTMSLAEDWRDRPLPGRQRVQRWVEDDNRRTERFGMSEDQFRGYRQTGMYGAYRLAFRTWPDMTQGGDGWSPGLATQRLAKWLDGKLGVALPQAMPGSSSSDGDPSGRRSFRKVAQGKEPDWWLKQWDKFCEGSRSADANTLPRPRQDHGGLPEAHLLEPVIFGTDAKGKQRRAVAKALEAMTQSEQTNHLAVCKALAKKFSSDPTIAMLPHFSRLADAGMEAMDLVARVLGNQAQVALVDVARHAQAKAVCAELFSAATDWQQRANSRLRHIDTAHDFAKRVSSAEPEVCLQAVLEQHQKKGGGLRWFELCNGQILSRTPAQPGSARYGFRLRSLCRLAAQCTVIKNIPAVFLAKDRSDDGDFGDRRDE